MAFEYAEPGALGDLARATVALLVWFYVALFTQSYAKIALVQRQRQEQFGMLSYRMVHYTDPDVARLKYGVPHDSPIALTADRTAGNLSEQLVPFLASAWLRALLVPGAAASSSRLCYAYLVSRMVYPFAFYAGHPLLQLSTQPGYLIVWGQLADVACYAGDPPTWYFRVKPPASARRPHSWGPMPAADVVGCIIVARSRVQICLFEGRWSPARTEVAIFTLGMACEVLLFGQWAAARLSKGDASKDQSDAITQPQTSRGRSRRKTQGNRGVAPSRSTS